MEKVNKKKKKLKFGASSPTVVRRQVDILELKDLEKEYILSRSRLTLAQHHPPSAAIAGTPEIHTRAHLSTLIATTQTYKCEQSVNCHRFLCRQRISCRDGGLAGPKWTL